MKLIQEYMFKIVLLVVVSIVVIEFFLTFLFVKRAKIIFSSIYSEAIEKTESKSIEITKKIEEYATNLLTRYMTDLKLICKHSQFLNGRLNTWNESNLINISSDTLLQNIKVNSKEIVISTLEELNQKDLKSEFPKYFSKISTKNFEYAGILTNELKRTNYGYSKMENGDEFLGEYKNEIQGSISFSSFSICS